MEIRKISFKNKERKQIGGFLRIPNGQGPFPAVVFVHGFGGSVKEPKNIFMCEELAKNGFVSLMFDFYNKPNGISEPEIENMTITQQLRTLKCAIDFVLGLDFVDKNRLGLTGHSLGGATVLLYTPNDSRIKTLVVQSAVSEFGKTSSTRRFAEENTKKQGYIVFEKSWGLMKVNYIFYEDGLKHNIQKTAEKIKCPTLIFHGDEDESVPLIQSQELFEHLKCEKKLEIIQGADHNYRKNETLPVATKLMVDWFKNNLNK